TIVFDGDPPQGWPASESLGAARVVHSGRGRTADDLILETIRKSKAPADLILVTSDRALYERGRRLGAKGLPGHAFRGMMAASSLKPSGARGGTDLEKPDRPSKEEIDYFLEAFGGGDSIDPSSSRKRR